MITFLKIIIILVLLDSIYLFNVKDAFNKQLLQIQNEEVRIKWISVFVCYILLTFGIYYFIVKEKRRLVDAFLLGIVIYGVYDSTNYATINKWSLSLSMIDTVWGGMLIMLTYFFVQKLN
jgi:uncharacterized membrane protein